MCKLHLLAAEIPLSQPHLVRTIHLTLPEQQREHKTVAISVIIVPFTQRRVR